MGVLIYALIYAWEGLERLFRYCARPIFSGERLSWQEEDERLIYRLPKPRHDGQTLLRLTPMRIIAFVTEIEPIGRILRHMGEPDYAPEISPARGPPNFCLEPDQVVDWDIAAIEPVPEYQFDQTVNW